MKEQIAYLSGLIDGVGTIILAKRCDRPSLKPTVQINMTNMEALLLAQAIFGGTVRPKKRAQPHHQDQWVWRVYNRMARECLQATIPYLIIKKDEAAAALTYMTTSRKRGRPRSSP